MNALEILKSLEGKTIKTIETTRDDSTSANYVEEIIITTTDGLQTRLVYCQDKYDDWDKGISVGEWTPLKLTV